MVFSLIIKLIKNAVDGFSNLCAFLLVKLGLWLPALFCVVYLLACAVMQIKLVGGAVGLFFGGVIACTVIGGFIALKNYGGKKMTHQKTLSRAPYGSLSTASTLDYPKTNSASRQDMVINSSFEYSERSNEHEEVQEVEVPRMQPKALEQTKKRSGTTYERLKERPYKYDDFNDLRAKYFEGKGSEGGASIQEEAFQSTRNQAEQKERQAPLYSNWTTQDDKIQAPIIREESRHQGLERGGLNHSFDRQNTPSQRGFIPCQERAEEPMIFATRRDPNVLIYEYSDRLEFYKKTRNGLEFLEQVNKG